MESSAEHFFFNLKKKSVRAVPFSPCHGQKISIDAS
jgi:hypothetical protein